LQNVENQEPINPSSWLIGLLHQGGFYPIYTTFCRYKNNYWRFKYPNSMFILITEPRTAVIGSKDKQKKQIFKAKIEAPSRIWAKNYALKFIILSGFISILLANRFRK
jgi:hypothetical protein